MSEPSAPHSSPATSGFPPGIPVKMPAQVKVLGILHLVFAALGAMMLVFTAAMQGFSRSILEKQEQAGGAEAAQAKMSKILSDSHQPWYWSQIGVSFVLCILLVIAGIGLLKGRRAGLKWSNIYGWLAIVLRLGSVVFFFVAIVPGLDAIVSTMRTGAKADETMIMVMKSTIIASGVGGPLFYCIYPVVVLALLNRVSVRNALR